MSEFLSIMAIPLVMSFVLIGIHAYFGLHVVSRGVIFVDIALAQVAALGSAIAIVFGAELGTLPAYLAGLAAALVGAGALTLTRQRVERVPQEAYIGVTYAVAAAAMLLVLSRWPHGTKDAEHLLVGQILWVDWPQVARTSFIYAILALTHIVWRKPLLLISMEPREAYRRGLSVRAWDFVFYATLGIAVTSSVQIAGVLMVFAMLVVPAVMGVLLTSSLRGRLILGWVIGLVIVMLGSVASYALDLPTGATIVCAFGVALAIVWLLRASVREETAS